MKKTRRAIFFASISLFGACVFFACESQAAGPTYISNNINAPAAWTREDSPYVVGGLIDVNAPLTVEAGTIVKFGRGGSLVIHDDFHVNGIPEEKVIFTSLRDDSVGGDTDKDGGAVKPAVADWNFLSLGPPAGKKIEIKCATVRYASYGLYISTPVEDISVKYSEIRKNAYGIFAYNPDLLLEKNIIANNSIAGIKVQSSSKTATAVNNAIFGNTIGAEGSNYGGLDKTALKAENNWWGDESGPENEDNPGGGGDPVSGLVSFDPWLEEDPVATPDPAIIIPGIMGSWEKDGVWQIDPIFHTYDNLIEAFIAAGYENDGKSMSVFPYEWRDSNIDNAKLLHKRIEQIKADTGRPKVDIVAHSMGGLLAREYIESDYYDDDVDQLITVGTPHLGAPKDYIKWEAGVFFADIFELAGKKFFEHEAKENGYDSIFHYIRGRPMESVRELLPVYDYLYDDNGSDYDLRTSYPENYPRNEFLENLNDAGRVKALQNIEFTNIVGKQFGQTTTTSGFNVINADMGELWQHGYPHGFEIPWVGDQGLRKSEGDRTIPLFSAESVQNSCNRTIYLQSNHNALPAYAQHDILEILTGKRPTNEITEWHIPNLLLVLVHSPVDIQVESPSGEKIGKNFETNGIYDEIEGAYYTGFDTNSEFITIPNPEDGEYKITTQGIGEGGEYKIETSKISENPGDPDNAKESLVAIEGKAQTGEIQEAEVEIAGDEVIYNPDDTPPAITISSPEEKDYNNDEILDIDYSVEDSESGVVTDFWQIEKDGQNLDWQEKGIDLSLEHLGDYTLKVSAADKTANLTEKEVKFQITTDIHAIQNNVNHYFDLGFVKKKIARKYLATKLRHLEKLLDLLEKTENSKLKPKPKQTAVNALKKIINADINRLIRQINRKSPRWIDTRAAGFLIEDLNCIKLL